MNLAGYEQSLRDDNLGARTRSTSAMSGARYPDCDRDVLEMIADVLGEVVGTDPELRGACAAYALAEVAAATITGLRAELVEARSTRPFGALLRRP